MTIESQRLVALRHGERAGEGSVLAMSRRRRQCFLVLGVANSIPGAGTIDLLAWVPLSGFMGGDFSLVCASVGAGKDCLS